MYNSRHILIPSDLWDRNNLCGLEGKESLRESEAESVSWKEILYVEGGDCLDSERA